ncbi:NUDIX domain-containing protein [Candidatus Uhrbacteria bacterium]|nr:NUDIX domain-containing protein [Candidatus Uhrbacteria bacterium]
MPLKSKPKSRVKMEFTAGGIVYQRTKHGPLIALILDPYGKWGLPKGHLEKSETPAAAALRETREELGIRRVRIIAPVGQTDIWFNERFRKGKRVRGERILIHKVIYYFLMEAPTGVRARPQRGEGIRTVEWVPTHLVVRRVSYKNLQSVLRRGVWIIQQRARRQA